MNFLTPYQRRSVLSDNLHEQKYKFLQTTILTVSDIEKILSESSDTAVQEIDSRLLELHKKLLKKANAKQNYDDLADEIEALREQKHAVMVENAEREGIKKRVAEMQQFLAEQKSEITEYDESLVRQLIEKITVYEDRFEVMFKSQTTVEIKRIF